MNTLIPVPSFSSTNSADALRYSQIAPLCGRLFHTCISQSISKTILTLKRLQKCPIAAVVDEYFSVGGD